MAIKTPLQEVTDRFGSKEKLVDKLVGQLDRGEESKDEFRDRLLAMANSKLLRLYDVSEEISKQFGDEKKLVDAILALMKREKDQDFREKLLQLTPVQLLARHGEEQKKARRKARKVA